MDRRFASSVLSDESVARIIEAGKEVLSNTGCRVENGALLDLLAEHGAAVDRAEQRARFGKKMIEALLEGSSDSYDAVDGVEASHLFPYGDRATYSHGVECTTGGYPTALLYPDGNVKPHTLASMAEMTRLADALEQIDRVGSMGVPSDVPAQVSPLYQRLVAWKNAERKLSNCGEVRSPELFDEIVEMGRIVAAEKKASVRRYAFGEVELVSPLRFARQEAAIFERFWKSGLLCGVGFMHSAGGSAPATLAGVLALEVAENLLVNLLYRYCYGFKKVWIQTNSGVLDMRRGMFAFGRPERTLLITAMGQVARRLRAGLWACAIYPDAKTPGCEAGMQSAFNVIPVILAGTLGCGCFGLLSGGDVNSPIQLILENELCGGLKRFARGLEVDDARLALEVIHEVGPGGNFMGHEHTLEWFRSEHWQPTIFSRESLASWLASDQKTDVDLAQERYREILRDHHPRGISESAERELMKVVKSAEKRLA